MMKKEEVFKLIKKANNLSTGSQKEALEVYLSLKGEKYYQIELMRLIAGCYFEMEEWEESLLEYKKLINLNPENEDVSLGIYVCLIELGDTEQGIAELNRYANKYPISLYKDTIVELLIGLNNGYGGSFKKTILSLAKRHHVYIPIGTTKLSDVFPPNSSHPDSSATLAVRHKKK